MSKGKSDRRQGCSYKMDGGDHIVWVLVGHCDNFVFYSG